MQPLLYLFLLLFSPEIHLIKEGRLGSTSVLCSSATYELHDWIQSSNLSLGFSILKTGVVGSQNSLEPPGRAYGVFNRAGGLPCASGTQIREILLLFLSTVGK